MAALVGRDRELDALDHVLRQAELGDRAVVMVSGEPGIGKTRLLTALAARARAVGGVAVWGRAAEVGATPAFWPWLQLLAALASPDDPAPAIDALAADASHAVRLARFTEVARYVARRANRLLVVVLDDLHAADPSSLQLLDHALPLWFGVPVVVAIGCRDGDAAPEVARALARLARSARRLALSRLAPVDVARLVGDRGDHARIFALSEGNPLFVEELLAVDADTARLPPGSSVRAILRERVARLPAATATVLSAAAVIGRDVPAELLVAVVEDDVVASAIASAVSAGVVIATPDGYRFSHALVAEVIADDLTPHQRARWHLAIADALEPRGELGAVAHHRLAAGAAAGLSAVAAAERAATLAQQRLAFEDAAHLLGRALSRLDQLAPGDLRWRAQLVCRRATALQHGGDHAAAAAACDDAAVLARRLDDAELLATAALIRGLEFRFGATDHALVELLREALVRVPAAPTATRARLQARLAAALQPAIDPAQPVAMAWEAIAAARAIDDTRARLDALYTATSALVDFASPAELAPLHDEVLALARLHGDRAIVVHTTLRQAFVELERGDRAQFQARVAAFAELATALGVSQWLRVPPMLGAIAAVLDGRFADDAAAVAEASALCAGDPHALTLIEIHRLIVRSIRTTPVGDGVAVLPMVGPRQAPVAAWLAAERGDLVAARDHLAAIDRTALVDPNFAAMVAIATAAVGDVVAAARWYELLAPRAGGVVVASMVGFVVQDLYDRLLLVLAAVAGHHDVVDRHAERALAVAARLNSPVWSARIRGDWADALARRGEDARAAELWREVRAAAERLDMPGLLARATAVALPPHPSATPPRLALTQVGALWQVDYGAARVHVRHARGLRMLAMLVEAPGRELHALELSGAGEVDGGDAGPHLDATARAAYRARLAELSAARDQAEAWGDHARVEAAVAELDALTSELARAFGLGGRPRTAGNAAERARSNVQRRLQHAIAQIAAACAPAGDHLAATIRTGTFCCYQPPT